jgi:hypothetical protein
MIVIDSLYLLARYDKATDLIYLHSNYFKQSVCQCDTINSHNNEMLSVECFCERAMYSNIICT